MKARSRFGSKPRRPASAIFFATNFAAIPEPAWHRRARQLRQGARLNVHNLAKAFDVLGSHHGSAMPKQFWSSAWQAGPPSWLQQPRQQLHDTLGQAAEDGRCDRVLALGRQGEQGS